MTDYPTRYCGIFLGNKSKALELRKVETGGYAEGNDGDASDMAKAMLDSGEAVSQWAVWDNREKAPKARQASPYTAAEFKTLLRGEEFALVWCKRGQFRAPVLKIGRINERTSTAGKRAAPTRFGK